MCSEHEINENKIAVEGKFKCEIIKEERSVREGVRDLKNSLFFFASSNGMGKKLRKKYLIMPKEKRPFVRGIIKTEKNALLIENVCYEEL